MDVVELEDHLEHHGILGMKWGVRRYQNKDGSLTAAGRQRYLNDDGSYNDTAKKEIPQTALSDDELRRTINRIQMEKQYKELTSKEKGRISKMISKALDNLVDSGARLISDSIIKKLRGKSLDDYDGDDLKDLMEDNESLSARDVAQLAKYIKNKQKIETYLKKGKIDDNDDKDDDD